VSGIVQMIMKGCCLAQEPLYPQGISVVFRWCLKEGVLVGNALRDESVGLTGLPLSPFRSLPLPRTWASSPIPPIPRRSRSSFPAKKQQAKFALGGSSGSLS
jgi:hypothetical protein